jgi:hypothetical protein
MLTLKEQLDAIKSKTAAMITPEVSAAMQKGFKELQGANLLEKTLKVGDPAPDFVLPNGEGKMIASEALRHHGPLVILFYRGKW